MASVFERFRENIRRWVMKGSSLEPLLKNPDDPSLRYIQDLEEVLQTEAKECEVWLNGNSNDLLNFYTQFSISDRWKEPIYNANRFNFFWAKSSREKDVKRVHSGVPKAIVKSIINSIGVPHIKSGDAELQKQIDEIIKGSDFVNVLRDEILPLTLGIGDVGVQINANVDISPYPSLSVSPFREIEPLIINGKLVGVVFKDFFKHEDKTYVRYQQRFAGKSSSFIKNELFMYEGGELKHPDFRKYPDLVDKLEDDIEVNNYDKPLCEYLRLNVNPKNKSRGVSILIDKIDLFDSIDQALSQQSRTIQKSAPVEYIPNSLIVKDNAGNELSTNDYDRTYRSYEGGITGEGEMANQIKTTQPQLNMEQYQVVIKFLIEIATLGIISPNTIGFSDSSNTEGLQYYNNSGASIIQKERISVNNRENIIRKLETFIKSLLVKMLLLKGIIDGKQIDDNYVFNNLTVSFDEYYKEGFADRNAVYSKMFTDGLLSPEFFVEYVWESKLTEEQKATMVAYIKEQQARDNLNFDDLISHVPNNEPQPQENE